MSEATDDLVDGAMETPPTPPIIVAGMHRSGTSLVVRLLDRLGVAMGAERLGNDESLLFQEINRTILDPLGASWRNLGFLPSGDRLVLDHPWAARRAARHVREHLVDRHFGAVGAGQLAAPYPRWGWKDPRNSLLLPVWRAVFPGAAIVHVVRDGRDVALSLLSREERRSGDRACTEPLFPEDVRATRFRHDVALWAAYEERIAVGVKGAACVHTMRYERLVAEPVTVIEEMAGALGLELSAGDAGGLAALVEDPGGPRHARPEHAWAKGIADDVQLLRTLGYVS